MSARVAIDDSADVLWVELKQNAGEVIRFAAFVLIVLAGVYSLTPAARNAPGALLAVIGVAVGWSIVALAGVTIPSTYRYACIYQPPHLRPTLSRLRARYGLPVGAQHLSGFYRRYSGDLADLGKGEILAWTS